VPVGTLLVLSNDMLSVPVKSLFPLMRYYQWEMITLIRTRILFLNLKYILPRAANTHIRFSAGHVPLSLKICIIYTKMFNLSLLLQ
jgi:hypothetical protein